MQIHRRQMSRILRSADAANSPADAPPGVDPTAFIQFEGFSVAKPGFLAYNKQNKELIH